MKNKWNRRVHDMIVDELFNRLSKKGKPNLQKNLIYCVEGVEGEVDILAHTKETNIYYFYEVKTSYYRKSHSKALKQFSRYQRTHPEQNVKGIFVSPQKILRMRFD